MRAGMETRPYIQSNVGDGVYNVPQRNVGDDSLGVPFYP